MEINLDIFSQKRGKQFSENTIRLVRLQQGLIICMPISRNIAFRRCCITPKKCISILQNENILSTLLKLGSILLSIFKINPITNSFHSCWNSAVTFIKHIPAFRRGQYLF